MQITPSSNSALQFLQFAQGNPDRGPTHRPPQQPQDEEDRRGDENHAQRHAHRGMIHYPGRPRNRCRCRKGRGTTSRAVDNSAALRIAETNNAMRVPTSIALALPALVCCAPLPDPAPSPLVIGDVRCESLVDPLGLDVRRPELSWKLTAAAGRGHSQTAFRVLVASDAARLAHGDADLWDSGVVASNATAHVPYDGVALAARTVCYWKVRVWDEHSRRSSWSAPGRWTMGLLARSDWRGTWIGGPRPAAATNTPPETARPAPGVDNPAPWLRRVFELPAAPRRAFVHIASLGYHELYVNGAKVGDDVLTPSISDLGARTRYVTRDVTALLRPGRNVLGLWLGAGWTNYERYAVPDKPIVLAELDVTLADGQRVQIATDSEWRTRPSPVSHLGPWRFGSYGGERIDLRRDLPGWNNADFDDSAWEPATVYDCDVELVADTLEPNLEIEVLAPIAIEELESGVYRVDMGRSFTGWARLRLRGKPGATIVLSTSERAEDRVTYGQVSELVLGDRDEGTFRHRFNYAVGRWITIQGATAPPELADIQGTLVRNGFRRAVRFSCSNPLLQRIQQTTQWTFECLSLGGYVVDCPHRERWGYGGDAHATMETALDHFNLGAFYAKWMADWRWAQNREGNLPHTCPTWAGGGGPAWSGICVMLPWEMYRRTGDRRVLEQTYPTMLRWLGFLETKCEGNILLKYFDESYTAEKYSFLGDWVPPGSQQGGNKLTEDTRFFNNAYRLMNVRTAARVAAVLGLHDDARRHEADASRIARAVHARFYDPAREVYASGRQTTLALPLVTGLAPWELRAGLLSRLEHSIRVEHRGHLDTGIHGTWFLVKALLDHGRNDLLFDIASKTTYPSWGHFLEQGATSMWEQWDGVHSHMHSSFLSIGAWFIEGIAGIRPDRRGPGYARFRIRPGLVGDLDWARCELDTVHGTITSAWRRAGDTVTLRVGVPVGAIAEVHMPAGQPENVFEGGAPAKRAPGVTLLRHQDGFAVYRVESGRYDFRSGPPNPKARLQSEPAAANFANVTW